MQVELAIGLTILECCNRALFEPYGRVQNVLGETKQGACVLAGMITESLWRELPWPGSIGEPSRRSSDGIVSRQPARPAHGEWRSTVA